MRKSFTILLLMFVCGWASAQITGTKTIPGNYANIAAAISAINTSGVGAGGVVFNIAAGHTETFASPTAGLITATGTAANPIVFQKSGAGANPVITAGIGTSPTVDGIIVIAGGDYITFDGIDLAESGSNATVTTQMEWGYAIVKASATDGAKNITIKNCTIILRKANVATKGIYGGNHLAVNTSALIITTNAGINANIKINGCSVTYCYNPISINGYTSDVNFYDTGLEIGSTTTNTITSYGGGSGTSYTWGIYVNGQNSPKIENNSVTSGSGTTSRVSGITVYDYCNGAIEINTNTVSVSSSSTTSYMYGIASFGRYATTVKISNNIVKDCFFSTATTANFRGITEGSAGSNCSVTITGNTIDGLTYSGAGLAGSGSVYGIYESMPVASITASNNIIKNISMAGTTGGYFYGMSINGKDQTISNNSIFNNTIGGTGTGGEINGIYSDNNSNNTVVCNGNTIYDNTITKTSGTGSIYGIRNKFYSAYETYSNNQIYNLAHSGTDPNVKVYGIYANSSTGTKTISGNSIHGLSSAGGSVFGIWQNANSSVISKNNIYDLTNSSTGNTAQVSGIWINTGLLVKTYNNLISDLKAPASNNINAIQGIYINGSYSSLDYVYYNTVYLNATSTGEIFGTSGIYASYSPLVDLRNNSIVNKSTTGSIEGKTVVYRRSGPDLSMYASTSNNNCFYAGTPSLSNLIFYDGTNSDQTLAAFQARVGTRDNLSVTEDVPFINVASTPYNLHVGTATATQVEGGGTAIATPFAVTDDFEGGARNGSTPDIGADEFSGTPLDISAPAIAYSTLANSSILTSRTFGNVAITDARGLNFTAGTKPRVYFKKSTEADTYAGNTSANNGWKFVETTSGSSPFSFTLNLTLLNSAAAIGDVIQYFIVAQDATPNVAINSGSFAVQPASVALTSAAFPIGGTINSYTLVSNISGTKTVGTGGDYGTIAAAIADLNANGVGLGGVTFNVVAGHTETFATPTTGLITNLTSSESNPVVFQKSGAGANPLVTAAVGASITSDGIILIAGGDYITFDGIDLKESDANTDVTTQMEWGYAIVKASATEGSQNITIRNCAVTLNKTNMATKGIYGGNHLANDITPLTITAASGKHANIKIHGCTLSNCYNPIYFNGPTALDYYDTGLEIGTSGANTLTNYGGGSDATSGISLNGQNAPKIENNIITMEPGSTSNVYGIVINTQCIGNHKINANTVSFSSGAVGNWMVGIYNWAPISTTLDITNNVIQGGTSTSTADRLYGILDRGYRGTGTVTITGNTIDGFHHTSSSSRTVVGICLYSNSQVNTAIVNTNTIKNCVMEGTGNVDFNAIYMTQSENLTVNNNTIFNNTTSNGQNSGIVFGNALVVVANSNNIHDNINQSGDVYGIVPYNDYISDTYSNNTIYNLENTNCANCKVAGLFASISGTTTRTVSGNTIYSLSSKGTVYGIYESYAKTNLFKNKVYDLTSTGDGSATGIWIYYANTVYVYNNFISDIKAPNATSTQPAVAGIRATDYSSDYTGYIGAWFNTIYLNATGTVSAFGSAGIYSHRDYTLDLRNNIVVNNSTPGATGKTVAYWRSNATLTKYATTSNNNSFYSGTPSATNLIFWDGTNADQTLTDFKNRMITRDQASVTENVAFENVATTPYDLHVKTTVATLLDDAGTPVTAPIAVTNDYDNAARNATTPDIGAHEFEYAPPPPVEVIATLGLTNGSYTTLFAAFNSINMGTHQGVITIKINASTTETVSAKLNASGVSTFPGISSYSSVTIYPTITGLSISGNIATAPLIDLNGADNVTIDGRVNQTGLKDLTITNTSTSATAGTSTIRFFNGATNDTIKNCNVQGSATMDVATAGATILFSTDGLTAYGNDNNTISNCDIGPAGANLPTKAILGNGSVISYVKRNSGNVITNNDIHDYFGAAVTSSGIATIGGCNTWSITNNRFYQTASRTWTTGAAHRAIDINNSTDAQGFTITGNIIGYASSTQTGTYTLTGSTGKFTGIYFNGIADGMVSNINSNTIASVSMTGVTSSGITFNSPFTAILVRSGLANTNSNTIGSQSAIGSLTFSTTTTTETNVYGIYNYSGDNWTANSNNIGSISVTNLGASGTFSIYGLKANTSYSRLFNATTNNIGGTIASSIQLTSTGASSQVVGIHVEAAIGNLTSNTVRNLTNNNGTGTAATASVIGMSLTTSSANHTVSQNTIYNLSNTHATAATVVTGIEFTGSTANIVNRNFIYGLSATSASAKLYGINITDGTTTYSNNIITLNGDNSSYLYGINDVAGTSKVYFNTVYIYGSTPTGVNKNSYCLYSNGSNVRNYRNNIFVNNRFSGYINPCVYINDLTNLTIDYNDYYYFITAGANQGVGMSSSQIYASLTLFQNYTGKDSHSKNANPIFASAGGVLPANYLPSESTLIAVSGTGVLIDYDSITRSTTLPSMGAYEYAVTPPCANPTSGGIIASDQTICVGSTSQEITSTSLPSGHSGDLEYQWQSSTDGIAFSNLVTGTYTSTTHQPGALNATTWFRRLARVSCMNGWAGCDTSNVVNITVQPILISTQAVSAITGTTATASGDITSTCGTNATNRGFIWYPYSDTLKTIGGYLVTTMDTTGSFSAGMFSKILTGLTPDTRYNARAYASNTAEVFYGDTVVFRTPINMPLAPTVDNPSMTTLDVTINENGNPASIEYAIHETTLDKFIQSDGKLGASTVWQAAALWGTKTIIELDTATTYVFEVKARNAALTETAYGNTISASTLKCYMGEAWTARTVAVTNLQPMAVTYGNGKFVAVSHGSNKVITSADGITWTAYTAPEANQWMSVTYGNNLFVAVSANGTNRVMTSADGETWTAQAAAEANSWQSVTYGNGKYVAVARDGTNRVMTSTNGTTWTAAAAAEANSWVSVIYANGKFVAVSVGGTKRVMTSTDGTIWTSQTTTGTNQWQSVTYGNGKYVAVAENGTNQAMTSTDGITWTNQTTPVGPWYAVTYGNGMFVAVGASSFTTPVPKKVMTSTDGVSWTARASADDESWWRSVVYGNDIFVAVANYDTHKIMTSDCNPVLTVTTQAATAMTTTSSTGNGTILLAGLTDPTDRGIILYPYTDTDKVIGGTSVTNVHEAGTFSTGAFTASLPSLTVNTRYNTRAHATDAGTGTAYGSRVDFWTLANVPAAPTVSTPTATTLNVAVNVNANPATTKFAIFDTVTDQYVQANGSLGADSLWQTAADWSTKTVTGLTTGTQYTFKVKARNGGKVETAFGATASGTPCASPSINSQSIAAQTVCDGGTFSAISLTATGTGLSYQWYSNAVADTTGMISLGSAHGAQDDSYTPQAATIGTLYYYCMVTGSCGTALSEVSGAFVTNSLTAPPAPTANDTTIYFGSTVTLYATGTPTGTLGWYDAATGGNWLYGSGSFTIPVLTNDTTYFVQDSVCTESATRTAVNVNISDICVSDTAGVITFTISDNGTSISDLHTSVAANILTITAANSQNRIALASGISPGISSDYTSTVTVDLNTFSTFAGISVIGGTGTDNVAIGSGGVDLASVPAGAAAQSVHIEIGSVNDQLTIANAITAKGTGNVYLRGGLGYSIGGLLSADTLTIISDSTVTQTAAISANRLILGQGTFDGGCYNSITNSGTYTLTNSSNDVSNFMACTDGSIHYIDISGVAINGKGAKVGGDFTLTAGGHLEVADCGLIMPDTTENLSLSTTSGAILIRHGGIYTGGNITLTSADSAITIGDNGIVSLGKVIASAYKNIIAGANCINNSSGKGVDLTSTIGSVQIKDVGLRSKGAVNVVASGAVTIESGGIDNSFGTGDLSITSSSDTVATSGSGIQSKGKITVLSYGNISALGGCFANSAGTGVDLTSTNGKITLGGSGLNSMGEVKIVASGTVASSGGGINNTMGTSNLSVTSINGLVTSMDNGLLSKGKITVLSYGNILASGSGIDNLPGTGVDLTSTNGSMNLQSGTLYSDGEVKVVASGAITVQSGGMNNLSGTGNLSLTSSTDTIFITGGGLQSKGKVVLSAHKNITVSTGGIVNSSGTGVDITSTNGAIRIIDGGLTSKGDVNVLGYGAIYTASGGISNTSGTGDISITSSAGSFANGSGGAVSSKGNIVVSTFGNILITSGGIGNTSGTGTIGIESSNGTISIQEAGVTSGNAISVVAYGNITLTNNGVSNTSGTGSINLHSNNGTVSFNEAGANAKDNAILCSDKVTISGPSLTSVGKKVTIFPANTNVAINLGGSDGTGILGISNPELNNIQADTVSLGDTVNTASITVSSKISDAIHKMIFITNPLGGISLSDSLKLKDVDLSQAHKYSTTILSRTSAQVMCVSGSVNLGTGTVLDISTTATGFIVGDSIKIIDNTLEDPISGTFSGLAQKDIFSILDGASATVYLKISYSGGDGNDVMLKVTDIVPTVAWDNTNPDIFDPITSTTATATAIIADTNAVIATNRGAIVYPYTDTDKTIGEADVINESTGGNFGTGTYPVSLTALTPNTRYNARAHATNSYGTGYSNRTDFWTLANIPSPPTVINPSATTLDVAVNSNGNPSATIFAIQDSVNNLYVKTDGTRGADTLWQTAAAWDTITVTGLSTGVTYYFRVKAKNGNNVETAFGKSTGQNTCSNPTVGGSIGTKQTICYGTKPSALTSVSLPTNYGGTLEYKWQYSTPTDSLLFTDIDHDSVGYAPGNLNTTTWYKRVARVSCKNNWTGAAESNVVKIIVHPQFTAGNIKKSGETICYNGDPAQIGDSISASGGNGAITYQWQSSTDNITYSDLSTGTYTSTTYTPDAGHTTTTWYSRSAKDATCNTSFITSAGIWKVTVNPQLFSSAYTNANVDCYSNNTGSVEVSVSGGTTTYEYTWSTEPAQTTALATGLTTGTYTVTVTDANLCTTTSSAIVTQPDALTATASLVANVSIYQGSDGSVTVSSGGGTTPYSYKWSSSPQQTSETASGLSVGTYWVTVTDAHTCSATSSVLVTQPTPPTVQVTTVVVTDIGSTQAVIDWTRGNGSGCAVFVMQGNTGTAPPTNNVSYPADTVFGTPASQVGTTGWYCVYDSTGTHVTVTGLAPSTDYMVHICEYNLGSKTYNTGTSPTNPANYTTYGTLLAAITVGENVSCNGLSDGIATVSASGGNPSYEYLWSTVPAQTAQTATGLSAGTYTVTVTDGVSATITSSIAVSQPDVLEANASISKAITCHQGSDGEVTVSVSGGTTTYSYVWSTTPIQSAATATGLAVGAYYVTVTDANGCTATSSTSLTQPGQWWPELTGPTPVCQNSTGNIYTTDAGMTLYAWLVSAGGTINSGGTGTDSTVIITWSGFGPQTVSVNYKTPSGCVAVEPTVKDVDVNIAPTPILTGEANVTQGQVVTYSTPYNAGNSYSWNASHGNPQLCFPYRNCLTLTWDFPCGVINPGFVRVTETIVSTGCSTTVTKWITIAP